MCTAAYLRNTFRTSKLRKWVQNLKFDYVINSTFLKRHSWVRVYNTNNIVVLLQQET